MLKFIQNLIKYLAGTCFWCRSLLKKGRPILEDFPIIPLPSSHAASDVSDSETSAFKIGKIGSVTKFYENNNPVSAAKLLSAKNKAKESGETT